MGYLKYSRLWLLLPFACLLAACNRDMQVPAYLYVDRTLLTTNDAEQGTASANISDVWVTVDGKNLGVYELPALVPVLASGTTKVQLQAGIKKNGVSSIRPVYPFYSPYTCYTEFKEGCCDTLYPTFSYQPSVKFVFKEDFEDAGVKFSPVDSSIGMSKTSDKQLVFSYPGEVNHFSGCIAMKPEQTYFEVITSVSFKKQLTYAFLEMDYNVTVDYEVGIYYQYNGRNIQTPICGVYRTGTLGKSQWKKIYINLTEAVNSNMNASQYKVYLKAVKTPADSALFLFDNIKIVNM